MTCAMAVQQGMATAREVGVALVGVVRSHHCGVVVDHLRPVADAGLVGLGLANSPAAMPAAGGRHAVFGTNPVAAVFPRRSADPLLIDLSLRSLVRPLPDAGAYYAPGSGHESVIADINGARLEARRGGLRLQGRNRELLAREQRVERLSGDEPLKIAAEVLFSERVARALPPGLDTFQRAFAIEHGEHRRCADLEQRVLALAGVVRAVEK